MGFLDRFKKQNEQQGQQTPKQVVDLSHKQEKGEMENALKTKTSLQKIEKAKHQKTILKDTSPDKKRDLSQSHVLLRPYVTEKTAHNSSAGTYVFVVSSDANRLQIKQAIKGVYGVLPVSVRIQRIGGATLRFRGIYGKQSDWKKAFVTLPKGKKIRSE